MHLLVDAICACRIMMLIPGEVTSEVVWLCVAYNVLAFLTQPLTGWWVDRGSTNRGLGLSMTLLVMACVIHQLPCTIVLLGLGNSLFHVWGGRNVARRTANNMMHLGLFVSTGALGLLLGSSYASVGLMWAMMATLMMSVAAYLWVERWQKCELLVQSQKQTMSGVPPAVGSKWLMALLILLVMIRSFYGQWAPNADSRLGNFGLLLTLLAVAGKMSGGLLCLRFGTWRALTLVLLVAGVAMVVSELGGSTGILALFLMVLAINVTMPMTLHLMNRQLPRREGLAFGLLAAALLPGVGLALLPVSLPILYALTATMVIESAVLLMLKEWRWQVLGVSILMNIVTNLLLNSLILYGMDSYPSIWMLVAMELLVTAVEQLCYYFVTHNWKMSLRYAVLCNGASASAGFLAWFFVV